LQLLPFDQSLLDKREKQKKKANRNDENGSEQEKRCERFRPGALVGAEADQKKQQQENKERMMTDAESVKSFLHRRSFQLRY
jgi:hypothetical protein